MINDYSPNILAQYIDQSVLKPEFSNTEIKQYIQEGINAGCKAVCINPNALSFAQELVAGSKTSLCVVCDFPFGQATTNSRVAMATEYCKNYNVDELDIVCNYGLLKSGAYNSIEQDLTAITTSCHTYKTLVKVILETDALNEKEIRKGCDLAIQAKADFVKTCTGFYLGGNCVGASTQIVSMILNQCKGKIKVKASGNIRTKEHFLNLISIGVDRMGIGYKSLKVVLDIE